MSVARKRFRTLMGRFATGVTVVTTAEGATNYGMTVNAFCSVSLDPCLVLISLRQDSTTAEVIRRSGHYAVNILTADQRLLAERFARHELHPDQRFAGIPFETRLTGAPLFTEALAHFECHLVAEHAGGDHTLLIGEVLGLESPAEAEEDAGTDGAAKDGPGLSPLLFYHSAYATISEEPVLPEVFPKQVTAAPAASGHGWSRGLGRLWGGLWRWTQPGGVATNGEPAGEAALDAPVVELSHTSGLSNGATAHTPADRVASRADGTVRR